MADNCENKPFYKQTWFFAAIIVLIIIVIVCQQANKKKTTKRDPLSNKKDNKKDKKKNKKDKKQNEPNDVEEFVSSGGRDDIGGGDYAMRDRIHAINAKQQQYVLNSATQYRYDERVDSAAPAIYSPEADLQSALYP